MKRKETSGTVRRKLLPVLVMAATLSSGASMALPMPPYGSLLVTTYYATADRDQVVGVDVYGDATCRNGPYPIDWGSHSQYSSLSFFACQGEGGGPTLPEL
jgi:hypothetical protein